MMTTWSATIHYEIRHSYESFGIEWRTFGEQIAALVPGKAQVRVEKKQDPNVLLLTPPEQERTIRAGWSKVVGNGSQ
jgi:hypothetical protein